MLSILGQTAMEKSLNEDDANEMNLVPHEESRNIEFVKEYAV